MIPARRRAIHLARQSVLARQNHSSTSSRIDQGPSTSTSSPSPSSNPSRELTGAARLLADAIEEESLAAGPSTSSSSTAQLRVTTQGPIWTGDESQHDAVLRMLVDAHKPLRSGEGIKHNASEEKIKGWMKGLKLEPRLGSTVPSLPEGEASAEQETEGNQHRTTIPPHLHRPWHATYTGSQHAEAVAPKVKYGTFIKKRATGDSLSNILELQLPPNADGKTRSKVRELRRTGKLVRRLDSAREGAIDYQLGLSGAEPDWVEVGEGLEEAEEGREGETFRGNRQVRGSSVLGAGKGGASGLRAWAGLVEDRIQRAREAGMFQIKNGRGKPIPRDPNASNPHIEHGELLMNRIVKRQGALPPWIEAQNTLDNALTAFRSTLLTTYTTHLVRSVISSTSLIPLPPLHAIPDQDESWEQRERKFHEENIKQINDLVRKMNAQAPAIVRRPLYTLGIEMDRLRGEPLRSAVWEEIQRRSQEVGKSPPSGGSSASGGIGMFMLEGEGISKLRRATRRSLSTLAIPVTAVIGKGKGGGFGDSNSSSGGGGGEGASSRGPEDDRSVRIGGFVAVGLGIVGLTLLRKPARNESLSPDLIPVRKPVHVAPTTDQLVATSPAEGHMTPLLFLQTYIFEPVGTFFRFLHLAILFAPVILLSPMLLVGRVERRRRHRPGKQVAEEEENWGALWWYAFLVKQMERAGPSFIKLGQWAASRADLFPASLCDKMSKLHSNAHPHSLAHTKRVIEKAFGLAFDEIFEEFGEKPIGCGAVAQVYKAKLRPQVLGVDMNDAVATQQRSALQHGEMDDAIPSTSVALKVLHPRVAKTIRRDIAIMSVFARAFNAIPGMEWISLPEEVTVFGEIMNSQLDLRVEAKNLERFNENFRKRGRRVKFPRGIKLGKMANGEEREESREVLMEEYEDALPLKYFLSNGGGPYDHRIANVGLDAFLEMLLLDNWTHGDLHPGNIMVRFFKPTTRDYLSPIISRFSKPAEPETVPHQSATANGLVHELSAIAHDREAWLDRLDELSAQGYDPQLIFIDAGLVTSLDDTNRRNFLELFSAVAEFDGYKAGKLMVERCRTPDHVIDEETFALKMQHIVLSVKSKTFSLAKIKISDILSDVLTAVRQHHVKLEGDFVNTVISILLLEGIGRQLDPDMDLFKSALPILRQLGRQMGTREAISAVPKGNIWAMAKLWVWVEARQVAGSVSAIDEWMKYDRLTPNI